MTNQRRIVISAHLLPWLRDVRAAVDPRHDGTRAMLSRLIAEHRDAADAVDVPAPPKRPAYLLVRGKAIDADDVRRARELRLSGKTHRQIADALGGLTARDITDLLRVGVRHG